MEILVPVWPARSTDRPAKQRLHELHRQRETLVRHGVPVVLVVGPQRLRRLRHEQEERVRGLNQNARAVAGIGLAAARTPVLQVDEHLERLADNRVRPPSLDIHHEPDAAGIALRSGVVETLGRRGKVAPIEHGRDIVPNGRA